MPEQSSTFRRGLCPAANIASAQIAPLLSIVVIESWTGRRLGPRSAV